MCTQPRRIAAVSVAQRFAASRLFSFYLFSIRVSDEWSGGTEKAGGTIGYHIRHEAKASGATRLLFCTTGIFLRRLAADPDLQGISHVVVDEVILRQFASDLINSFNRSTNVTWTQTFCLFY